MLWKSKAACFSLITCRFYLETDRFPFVCYYGQQICLLLAFNCVISGEGVYNCCLHLELFLLNCRLSAPILNVVASYSKLFHLEMCSVWVMQVKLGSQCHCYPLLIHEKRIRISRMFLLYRHQLGISSKCLMHFQMWLSCIGTYELYTSQVHNCPSAGQSWTFFFLQSPSGPSWIPAFSELTSFSQFLL